MHDSPAQIGPYRLLERLGYGGMCEVFRARVFGASGFEKTVALKVLLPKYRQEAEYQRQFIREARIGARLSHRNIVGIQDFGVADGVHYLRMDLVEGLNLAALQNAAPLPTGLALFVAAELALALDYLHGCTDERGRPMGLVHRDVGPSNVLVSTHGEVRLSDFGILKATAYADQTRGEVRKGTYAYMSPEQLAGGELGPASDLFSLGIVLAELIAGRHPFPADDVIGTMNRIENAADPDLDGLDGPPLRVVDRCLEPAPEDRYSDAAELYRELTALRREFDDATPLDLARRVRAVRSRG